MSINVGCNISGDHKLKSPDNSYSYYFSPLSTATHLLRGGGEGGGGGEEVEEVAHQAGHLLRGDPPAVVPVEHPGGREGGAAPSPEDLAQLAGGRLPKQRILRDFCQDLC